MNGPRDEFFAGARFAADQNRRIAARDLGYLRQDCGERGRGADNLFKHRRLVDLLSQRNVFLLQSLLGPLAFIDIRTREIPTNHLSLVVAEWIVPNQEPTICPVAASETHVPLVIGGVRTRTIDQTLDSIDVVRMQFS